MITQQHRLPVALATKHVGCDSIYPSSYSEPSDIAACQHLSEQVNTCLKALVLLSPVL